MAGEHDRRRLDLVPLLVLALVLLLGLAGVWAFPRLQRALAFQDCIATGRVNCGP